MSTGTTLSKVGRPVTLVSEQVRQALIATSPSLTSADRCEDTGGGGRGDNGRGEKNPEAVSLAQGRKSRRSDEGASGEDDGWHAWL